MMSYLLPVTQPLDTRPRAPKAKMLPISPSCMPRVRGTLKRSYGRVPDSLPYRQQMMTQMSRQLFSALPKVRQ